MTKKNIAIDKKKLSREAIAVAVDGKTLPIEINSSIILTYGNEPVMMNCIGISIDSDKKLNTCLRHTVTTLSGHLNGSVSLRY